MFLHTAWSVINYCLIYHFQGLRHYVESKNKTIFTSGCVLHLVHIAAEKGAGQLPVSASDLLTDIYYYLNKSSLRQDKLKDCQELRGLETKKMLKHVCTRWLSIGRWLLSILFSRLITFSFIFNNWSHFLWYMFNQSLKCCY